MHEEFLFVYGSLRCAASHAMHRILAQDADWLGEASYQGLLYRIARYPGAIPAAQPQQRVYGEVYRLRHPASTLAALDDYEEIGPHFATPHEYRRVLQSIELHNDERISAWIYLYNRSVDGLTLIPGGDYLAEYQCRVTASSS